MIQARAVWLTSILLLPVDFATIVAVASGMVWWGRVPCLQWWSQ